MLDVTIDLMIEKLLPTHSLFRISFKHLSDQIFTHIWDIVDSSWELEVLLSDHGFELVDIFSVVRRSSKKHPIITNS